MLTGEACHFGMRILCDLSERGAALIRDFIGLPPSVKLADNWNSSVGGEPSVASIMLSPSSLNELVAFAVLRRQEYRYVAILKDGCVVAFADTPDDCKAFAEVYGKREYKLLSGLAGAPHQGSRNIHAATGRSL